MESLGGSSAGGLFVMNTFRCAFTTFAYVGSLYLIPSSIRSKKRDDPEHIKARLMAVTLAIALSAAAVYFSQDKADRQPVWRLLGFTADLASSARSAAIAIVLMSIFYLGPIMVQLLNILMRMRYKLPSMELREECISPILVIKEIGHNTLDRYDFSYLKLFRDIVFAPVSEEVVFRALLINIMYQQSCVSSGKSVKECTTEIAFHCSLWFGLAHAHHCYTKVVLDGMPLKSVAIQFLVQFSYTSIFGCIAVILFLRTGSVVAPIISHMFCNFQQLPDLSFMRNPSMQSSGMYLGQYANHLFYKARYLFLILHALGLVLFAFALFPMTSIDSQSSHFWLSSRS